MRYGIVGKIIGYYHQLLSLQTQFSKMDDYIQTRYVDRIEKKKIICYLKLKCVV